jgi:acetone carboxylase gamma subunit
MWDRISTLWCKSMHSKAMWPMHGKYICPDCFREYPVEWTGVPRDEETTYAWTAKQAKERLGTM